MTSVAAAQALELRRLGSLAHGPAPAAAAGGSDEAAELDGDGRLWEDEPAAVLTIRYDGATQRRRYRQRQDTHTTQRRRYRRAAAARLRATRRSGGMPESG